MDYQSENEILARAVADDLTKASSKLAVNFIARYEASLNVELKDLRVTLVTVRDAAERMVGFASRSESDHEFDVEVAIRCQVGDDESKVVSRNKLLGRQIADRYRFYSPRGAEQRLKRIDNLVAGPENRVDELQVSMVIMTLVFQGFRE